MSNPYEEKPQEHLSASDSAATKFSSPSHAFNEVTSGPKQGFGSPAPTEVASPAAKQLDFGAKEPATPSTPPNVGATQGQQIDYNQFIMDTLLWKNPVRSAVYSVSGLLLVYLVYVALNSESSLITGLCYLLLAQTALNFARTSINTKLQEQAAWTSSPWTQALINNHTTTVKALAAVHDKHLSALDPMKTLKIAVGLWLLSFFGRTISTWTLVVIVYVAAFSLPKVYSMYQKQIDQAVQDAYVQAKNQFGALDRKLQALAIFVPLLLLCYLFSITDRAIAAFIAVLFARTLLKPSEVEAISKRAQPLTATASKFSSRISNLASDIGQKYDLTPTPSKKKNV